jgi:hypothetical protein
VSQQKIPVVVGEVPPCFALVEHFGGKQIINYRYWIFRGGTHDPPMGQALVAFQAAWCLPPFPYGLFCDSITHELNQEIRLNLLINPHTNTLLRTVMDRTKVPLPTLPTVPLMVRFPSTPPLVIVRMVAGLPVPMIPVIPPAVLSTQNCVRLQHYKDTEHWKNGVHDDDPVLW